MFRIVFGAWLVAKIYRNSAHRKNEFKLSNMKIIHSMIRMMEVYIFLPSIIPSPISSGCASIIQCKECIFLVIA